MNTSQRLELIESFKYLQRETKISTIKEYAPNSEKHKLLVNYYAYLLAIGCAPKTTKSFRDLIGIVVNNVDHVTESKWATIALELRNNSTPENIEHVLYTINDLFAENPPITLMLKLFDIIEDKQDFLDKIKNISTTTFYLNLLIQISKTDRELPDNNRRPLAALRRAANSQPAAAGAYSAIEALWDAARANPRA